MRVEIVDAALKVPAIPETRPKRAERRKKWLARRRGGSAEPFVRQPGSLRPFHRIQALTAQLVEANKVLVGLLAIRPGLLAGYKSRGHGWKQ
jgi:hypothetical protein